MARQQKLDTQISLRLSAGLYDFYRELAERERRRPSDMLRIILEDHAKKLQTEEAEPAAA